jgi:hypothetical protein
MFNALRAPLARLAAVLFGVSGIAGANAASAAGAQIEKTADYKLELLTPKVPVGQATLEVRFVDGAGKPVSGAAVTARRLDMSPSGMDAMTAPITPAKGANPGIYRFGTALSMPGRWALTVEAKAPGQKGSMTATYVVLAGQ